MSCYEWFHQKCKKLLRKVFTNKAANFFCKGAAKDLASYAAKDLVRSSSTFTSEMKCEFLSYFGKIYYKTLHVFIFTLIIYLLKIGILNDFLRKKKLGMVFAKRFHQFCLKVIEMCSI